MKRFTIFASIALIVGAGAWTAVTLASDNCDSVTIGSWRGCEPVVETAGVVSTDKYSAVVQAHFSSQGADYNTVDQPSLVIEYGLASRGNLDKVTKPVIQGKGARTTAFLINGLAEGEKYFYQAVLYWPGGRMEGSIKSVTPKQQTLGTGTSPAGTPSTAEDNSVIVPAPTIPATNTGIFTNLFGGSKKTTTTTNTSPFVNVMEKSGFKLAIDNGETLVTQGDVVTTKVRYENNNTKSYDNSLIEIYLPPEYVFESTNKGVYDRVDNKIVISLREFPAGGFGTAIITANATGKSGSIDQVVSQAVLKAGSTTLKVSDVDEYTTGSRKGSLLGASASGTGFLPASLIGWIILLVVLAGIVIVGRRYFIKKDY